MADSAWAELQTQRKRCDRTQCLVDQQVAELEKRANNLAKAIAMGGELEALVQQLREVNQQLQEAKKKQAVPAGQPSPSALFRSRQEVESRLEEALLAVAQSSFEFTELMRRVFPVFVIQPVQALDSGQVRPRARLTFRPGAIMSNEQGAEQTTDIQIEIDLFDPPKHIRHTPQCLAEKAREPKLSLKKIAARLGLNCMVVKRALDYGRRMQQAGTSDPCRVLSERPANAARWKPRRPSA
jgi:hypothetical protein